MGTARCPKCLSWEPVGPSLRSNILFELFLVLDRLPRTIRVYRELQRISKPNRVQSRRIDEGHWRTHFIHGQSNTVERVSRPVSTPQATKGGHSPLTNRISHVRSFGSSTKMLLLSYPSTAIPVGIRGWHHQKRSCHASCFSRHGVSKRALA
jgi:hypothetical protein